MSPTALASPTSQIANIKARMNGTTRAKEPREHDATARAHPQTSFQATCMCVSYSQADLQLWIPSHSTESFESYTLAEF
jgi:hypothetical protein